MAGNLKVSAGVCVAVLAMLSVGCTGRDVRSASAPRPSKQAVLPHDIIDYCPAGILMAKAGASDHASAAAADYMRRVGGWKDLRVLATYRVGERAGSYSEVFNFNVPRSCGNTDASNVYVVEMLDTTGAWHGSDTHAEVVASRFHDGWRVWGAYR